MPEETQKMPATGGTDPLLGDSQTAEIVYAVVNEMARRRQAGEPLLQPENFRFRMTGANWRETAQSVLLMVAGVIALKNGVVGVEMLSDFAAPLREAVEQSPILSTLFAAGLAKLTGEFVSKTDRPEVV